MDTLAPSLVQHLGAHDTISMVKGMEKLLKVILYDASAII